MAPDPNETDDELLMRLRCGDEPAFLQLYRRWQGAIYRFALHMSGSRVLAEDVTQDVFLVLIRDFSGYDPDRGTLAGYLFGIARKLLLRHAERSRGDVPLDPDTDAGVGSDLAGAADLLTELTQRERLDALRRAVAALPPRYREVVVLCDLEEVDYTDAAAALGCPIGTVRSRLHRARGLLLQKLRQEHGPQPAMARLKAVRSVS